MRVFTAALALVGSALIGAVIGGFVGNVLRETMVATGADTGTVRNLVWVVQRDGTTRLSAWILSGIILGTVLAIFAAVAGLTRALRHTPEEPAIPADTPSRPISGKL